MKKIFFLMFSLLMTGYIAADSYFFAPGEGLGEADGSSWENAAAAEYLGMTLAEAAPGTTFYLMEGNYAPDATTLKWVFPEGVTVKGGYPSTMTGTDTNYDYALGGQSVFSADLDGDGVGNNSNYAFVYFGKGDVSEKDDYMCSDFMTTEVWGVTFRDGLRMDSKYWGNMVFIKHAKADFHFCRFINNQSLVTDAGNSGSNGAIEIWGSVVRCFDCIFRDNVTSAGSGAAFQVRARNSNSSNPAANELSTVLMNRCEFSNNIARNNKSNAWGTYGGACSVSDNGGTVYIVNSTFANNKARYRGVGIRLGTNAQGYFINSTFFDNPCMQGPEGTTNNGSAVSAGTGASAYFANNIMVEFAANDLFTVGNAVVYLQAPTTNGISAGYNVFGTTEKAGASITGWPVTDNLRTQTNTITIETVFGTNVLAENGGVSKTIAPTMDVTGMVVADLQTAVAAWPIATEVASVLDLNLDQRGYTRASTTMSGAYDAAAVAPTPSSIEQVLPVDNSGRMFNVLGQEVAEDYKGVVIRNGRKYLNK